MEGGVMMENGERGEREQEREEEEEEEGREEEGRRGGKSFERGGASLRDRSRNE